MSDNVLIHYGVKGMKWGVRKDYGKSDNKYKRGRNGDIVVKKGTVLTRMSTVDEEGMIDDSASFMPDKYKEKHAYASIDGPDADAYVGHLAVYSDYKIDYKAKHDLISPGEKKRIDTFMEIFNNDREGISRTMAINAPISTKDGKDKWTLSDEQREKTYKDVQQSFLNMSKKDLRSKGYYAFCCSLDSSSKTRTAFFDSLKKQGYNFVVDDADRSLQYADMPLIVFDRNKNLKPIKTTYVGEFSDKAVNAEKRYYLNKKAGNTKGAKKKVDDVWIEGAGWNKHVPQYYSEEARQYLEFGGY